MSAGDFDPSSGECTGIDVDGQVATVATISAGTIVSSRSFHASSGIQALSDALATVSSTDHVRIVLSSPKTVCKLSAADQPAELSTADPVASLPVPGERFMLFSAPAAAVDAAYDVASQHPRAHVTTPVGALTGFSGLWLRIGSRVVDAAVMVDGLPLGYEVLPIQGLVSLIEDLGGQSAQDRVWQALEGTYTDPVAAAEVSRWLARVVGHFSTAAAQWRVDGLSASSTVWVAGLPTSLVEPYLLDAGFRPDMHARLPASGSLSAASRAAGFLATSAALSAARPYLLSSAQSKALARRTARTTYWALSRFAAMFLALLLVPSAAVVLAHALAGPSATSSDYYQAYTRSLADLALSLPAEAVLTSAQYPQVRLSGLGPDFVPPAGWTAQYSDSDEIVLVWQR